ncbi:AraC family transcriptional regulator [Puia dinghuensis]|uniref:AraC family transcriptional regulator n=2 Tax=Puia dinghuensis TaxID=1792502 RepID=A0A8J2UDF2_9BACT|nr:AraC family transcriptional regulator [Puia dinghuensis]
MMSGNLLLNIAGPADVFNYADKLLRLSGSSRGYDVTIVSPTRKSKTICTSGIEIACKHSAMDIKGPIDTVLVAGNDLSKLEDPEYAAFFSWLSTLEKQNTRRIGSVCGGAFALAKAGLLNGRRATTHWDLCPRLKNGYPLVKVDANAFYTQDGPIYTSGGVTSGVDLALALVEQDHGKEVAVEVARKLVVFLSRPGFQVQFGHLLPVFETASIAEKLRPWLSEHMHEQLDVVRLATHLSMSPRNFTRVFHKQTGVPPAKYIEKLRIESARKYLEDTDFSLEHIAERCGLGGLVSMRRTFLRHLMTTPSEYRRAFQKIE